MRYEFPVDRFAGSLGVQDEGGGERRVGRPVRREELVVHPGGQHRLVGRVRQPAAETGARSVSTGFNDLLEVAKAIA